MGPCITNGGQGAWEPSSYDGGVHRACPGGAPGGARLWLELAGAPGGGDSTSLISGGANCELPGLGWGRRRSSAGTGKLRPLPPKFHLVLAGGEDGEETRSPERAGCRKGGQGRGSPQRRVVSSPPLGPRVGGRRTRAGAGGRALASCLPRRARRAARSEPTCVGVSGPAAGESAEAGRGEALGAGGAPGLNRAARCR